MVFFILTTHGYRELVNLLGRSPSPVWLNAGVLDQDEVDILRNNGDDVTVFSEPKVPEDENEILGAVDTIRMHHEGESIWVEMI